MCFCNEKIRTPFCDSFKCQEELKRLKKKRDETFEDRTEQYKARMQLMWEWIGIVNKATGIEPPEEFFKWFDETGKPF